jgi:hypothetical protein
VIMAPANRKSANFSAPRSTEVKKLKRPCMP